MKNQKVNNAAANAPRPKRLSKIRIFFGSLLLILSALMAGSFTSYLFNWRADQSQAGMMLDRTIRSSNLFGKLGDWLGKIFIFDSLLAPLFISFICYLTLYILWISIWQNPGLIAVFTFPPFGLIAVIIWQNLGLLPYLSILSHHSHSLPIISPWFIQYSI